MIANRTSTFGLVLAGLLAIATTALPAEQPLWQAWADADIATLPARDVDLAVVERDGGRWLRMETGHTYNWPGITLTPAAGMWDLSACEALALEARNASDRAVRVNLRTESVDADGKRTTLQEGVDLAPDQQGTLRLTLKRRINQWMHVDE